MTNPVKILGIDDEADFEALIRQRFRRQVRDGEFTFCFAIMARTPSTCWQRNQTSI